MFLESQGVENKARFKGQTIKIQPFHWLDNSWLLLSDFVRITPFNTIITTLCYIMIIDCSIYNQWKMIRWFE